MLLSYSPADLIPHRGPMLLIDEIVDIDERSQKLIAAVTVKSEWSANCVAIEYMAQTAAALAGYFDKLENREGSPRPGVLLGTRKMELHIDRFEVNKRYLIEAVSGYTDNQAASFDCRILDGDKVVASARLSAFRPDDFYGFLRGMLNQEFSK